MQDLLPEQGQREDKGTWGMSTSGLGMQPQPNQDHKKTEPGGGCYSNEQL